MLESLTRPNFADGASLVQWNGRPFGPESDNIAVSMVYPLRSKTL